MVGGVLGDPFVCSIVLFGAAPVIRGLSDLFVAGSVRLGLVVVLAVLTSAC